MRVYLVQHADALPADADPARPLSPTGVRQADGAARFLASLSVRPDRIVHSGKERARHTAEIIATALGCASVEPRAGIDPNDDPAPIAEELIAATDSPMIVGHMPFLRRLANALLGTGALDPIDFDNASPLVLIRDGGRFRIEAYAKNAIIA